MNRVPSAEVPLSLQGTPCSWRYSTRDPCQRVIGTGTTRILNPRLPELAPVTRPWARPPKLLQLLLRESSRIAVTITGELQQNSKEPSKDCSVTSSDRRNFSG